MMRINSDGKFIIILNPIPTQFCDNDYDTATVFLPVNQMQNQILSDVWGSGLHKTNNILCFMNAQNGHERIYLCTKIIA